MLFTKKKSGLAVLRLAAVCLFLSCFLLVSCSRYIGYGVMNWSVPEMGLSAGDIVPVCIRSNISNLYVIEIETSEGAGRREVPLWQLTFYSSRSKAEKAAAGSQEFRYMYASVKSDGLPIREEPDNTSRQVYRLRQSEIIKITGQGDGIPVFAGDSPLEGDWYTVMTGDGTTGWCFSYNLTLFDERDGIAVENSGESAAVPDSRMEYILSRVWYPSEYKTMLDSGMVDIKQVNPAWGFFPSPDSKTARIEDENGVISFPYTEVIQDSSGSYRFDGSSLSVELRRGGTLVVQYTDENGMPAVRYFTGLDITPDKMIEDELARRAEQLARIVRAGPRFVSSSYGVLQFAENGGFLWNGYGILVPSVIPEGAGAGGRAEIECFLSGQVGSLYDGVISLYFDGLENRVNFLYTFSDGGIKLEAVSSANISDDTVVSRDISPTIMFFYSEGGGEN